MIYPARKLSQLKITKQYKYLSVLFLLDEKAACAIIAGSLKYRRQWTLLECEIECCNSSNCNDGGKINITSQEKREGMGISRTVVAYATGDQIEV